jgi:hypothetical protein
MTVRPEDIDLFSKKLQEYRYDFCKLVYLIFPFGEKGHELEFMAPYDWQMEEWAKLSRHLADPATRYETYRLIISSGNGAAKTAFGAMTMLMLLYTQRLHARITANTDPQMESIVWPEWDIWFRRARFIDVFFEKFGKSIKARNEKLSEKWRIDRVTWSEESPAAISGLHNKGGAVAYLFEEAPGIPANIWDYTRGAFSETGTIKLFFAFGNSDDPESKFEQNMSSPLWHAVRIDTRTLTHIDQNFVRDILHECGGNEDHDEFRVRVRGLPRKTSKDSIINIEKVRAAMARAKDFDRATVRNLPLILTCDPAWTGGDDSTIGYAQGNYRCLLEKYKLSRELNEDHSLTYQKLCYWEKELKADAVFIDQGEGTAIFTLAQNNGKTNWYLINFASNPTDKMDPKESEYANLRAQMYYETAKWLNSGVLDVRKCEESERENWAEHVERQLCWTKGGRHKITQKKLCEPKLDIKARVGQSPDVADVLVLPSAMEITEKNDSYGDGETIGQGALRMPDHGDPYAIIDAEYQRLYD